MLLSEKYKLRYSWSIFLDDSQVEATPIKIPDAAGLKPLDYISRFYGGNVRLNEYFEKSVKVVSLLIPVKENSFAQQIPETILEM